MQSQPLTHSLVCTVLQPACGWPGTDSRWGVAYSTKARGCHTLGVKWSGSWHLQQCEALGAQVQSTGSFLCSAQHPRSQQRLQLWDRGLPFQEEAAIPPLPRSYAYSDQSRIALHINCAFHLWGTLTKARLASTCVAKDDLLPLAPI